MFSSTTQIADAPETWPNHSTLREPADLNGLAHLDGSQEILNDFDNFSEYAVHFSPFGRNIENSYEF
jgi:hypothetical protein